MKKIFLFLILVFVLNFNFSVLANDIPQGLLDSINTAFNDKNYNKVVQVANKIIKIDSTNSYVYRLRAIANEELCSESNCNYKAIVDDYSKAIKYDKHMSNNNTSSLYHGRANAQFELKEYETAIADYTTAINLNDFDDSAWATLLFYKRAEARVGIEDYNGAIVDCTRAIKISKKNDKFLKMISYIKRGYAYLKINEYKKAIKDATRAIKIQENNSSAYFLRGKAKILTIPSRKHNTIYDILENISICESARQDLNIAKEYSLMENDMEYYKEILEVQKMVNEIIKEERKLLNN